jgi:hypothetical protein
VVPDELLAAVTLTVMNATILSWFKGQYSDLTAPAQQVLIELQNREAQQRLGEPLLHNNIYTAIVRID